MAIKKDSGRPLNRRQFLTMAGLGGGAALLAACGAQPTAAPTSAPAPTEAPKAEAPAVEATKAPEAAPAEPTAVPTQRTISDAVDPDAINFWTPGGSAVYCANFDKISADFTAANPGIKVGGVQCGAGDQNFLEIFLARVAAGNPPDVSIIWDSPVSLAARGALEPLDDLMKASQFSQADNWPPGVLASCLFKGRTYGLPVAAGTYGMYYNEGTLVSKNLPSKRSEQPKTWDDLRKLSKELTVWKDDKLVSVGYLPTTIDAIEMNIWSALNGSQFYDGAGNKFTIDSPQNIEMFEFFLNWFNEEYKGDLTAVNNSANWGSYPDGNGRPAQWNEGNMAYYSSGFWISGDMYGSEMKEAAKTWNVAQYPVGPSGSGTKSGYWPNWMVVPKGAKKAAEGFKYADYMSGVGIKTWFAAVPDLPVNKNVPADLLPTKVAQERGEAFAKDMMAFFRGQLDVATPMWNSPVQNFANDQVTRVIEQVFTKKSAPKDALAEAQKACQAELEKVLKSS
jgi:multiple sugar transport system substrate-binding protein